MAAWRSQSSESWDRPTRRTSGTRRRGGSALHRRQVIALRVRGAFTSMKALGTRTRGTATTAGCSSLRARIGQWVDVQTDAPTSTHRESSYFGPGWYGHATDIHGASGEQRERAGSGDAWERANREKLNDDPVKAEWSYQRDDPRHPLYDDRAGG